MGYEFMICYDTLPEINTLDWTGEDFLSSFAENASKAQSHLIVIIIQFCSRLN